MIVDDDRDDDRDGDYGESDDDDSSARMAVGKSGCEGVEWKPLWSGRLLFLTQEKRNLGPIFSQNILSLYRLPVKKQKQGERGVWLHLV